VLITIARILAQIAYVKSMYSLNAMKSDSTKLFYTGL